MNLLVFVAMLLASNLASYVILQVYRSMRNTPVNGETTGGVDDRWTLPNYAGNHERAKLIFDEFASLSTEYMPFVGWSRLPFKGQTTTVNADGERVHPVPPRTGKPRGVVRFFGGSTMWGTGADDSGTIPAIFNQRHAAFTVRNHGESAFNSRQSLDRLITLMSQGERADVVVFMDGVNEVSQECYTGISVPGHGRMLQIREALRVLRLSADRAWILRRAAYVAFVEHTAQLAQALRYRLIPEPAVTSVARADAPQGSYECDENPGKRRAVAEIMLANWELARTLVEARGGHFLGVLQPNAHVGSPRIDHLKGRLWKELGINCQVVYPLLRELIRSRHDPEFVDLSDVLDGDQLFFVDDSHVTEKGNAVIVDAIERSLAKLGWGDLEARSGSP
jgi:lysophospholipase L1-like esterase